LLNVYAQYYVHIGQIYEKYEIVSKVSDPEQRPSNEQIEKFIETLKTLRENCSQTRMHIATRVLDKMIQEFRTAPPRQREAAQRMAEWFRCFTSELEGQLYMLVFPHRAPYWSSPAPTIIQKTAGDEIWKLLSPLIESFPDAMFDATEAGNCFAFERFTACVYHLMRVAEYGLVSVSRAINVPEERLSKGWDGCIQGIESRIKTIGSTKPTKDWQEETKKYGDLCSWFTTIKTGWRNPVSHIPRVYSENTAAGMFAATVTLFEHLRQQTFKQTTMPSAPILLPED
jgi:hypothetical protein